MINIRIKNLYGLLLSIGLTSVSSYPLFAQQRLGDNLGNHKAGQDLDMNTKSITNADVINANGAVIGQVGAVNNTHVALQVNGTNQAMLVPRVTDLLNATTPSIPVANAVNGMIVYDLA